MKDYIAGRYGNAPGMISETLLSLEENEASNERYADLLTDQFKELAEEYRQREYDETDILSLLLFPEQAEAFLKSRYGAENFQDIDLWETEEERYLPNPGDIPDWDVEQDDGSQERDRCVLAALPGSVVSVLTQEQEHVEKDQPVLVLETMKMENEITIPSEATICKIFVKAGDKVKKGDRLLEYVIPETVTA